MDGCEIHSKYKEETVTIIFVRTPKFGLRLHVLNCYVHLLIFICANHLEAQKAATLTGKKAT